MGHGTESHAWGSAYEHAGSSYRECTIEDCRCYQEWICALDRWSDPFDTPSPRHRTEQKHSKTKSPAAR